VTFKLPGLPSPRANLNELADFTELVGWEQGQVSEREIVAYLGRIDDNDLQPGCDDDEDCSSETLAEVMNEIERRERACRGGYPFELQKSGTVLKYLDGRSDETESIVYRYLLLSTRLDMIKNKELAGEDGTALLEHLSAHVLKNYLGERAKSFVFGTAESSTFEKRIRNLCESLREGVGFHPLDGDRSITEKDDKLDTVAWVPFVDASPGQLIVFGQCKTGTNWKDQTTQLQPSAFVKRWLAESFIVDPLRAFCVSEAVDRSRWKSIGTSTGILFDRCRIVDYCDGFATTDLLKWTNAARESFGILSTTPNEIVREITGEARRRRTAKKK
jgi:hypothetical protein